MKPRYIVKSVPTSVPTYLPEDPEAMFIHQNPRDRINDKGRNLIENFNAYATSHGPDAHLQIRLLRDAYFEGSTLADVLEFGWYVFVLPTNEQNPYAWELKLLIDELEAGCYYLPITKEDLVDYEK